MEPALPPPPTAAGAPVAMPPPVDPKYLRNMRKKFRLP